MGAWTELVVESTCMICLTCQKKEEYYCVWAKRFGDLYIVAWVVAMGISVDVAKGIRKITSGMEFVYGMVQGVVMGYRRWNGYRNR
jgi:hypothetical protein